MIATLFLETLLFILFLQTVLRLVVFIAGATRLTRAGRLDTFTRRLAGHFQLMGPGYVETGIPQPDPVNAQ
jgi:hypothetical protein